MPNPHRHRLSIEIRDLRALLATQRPEAMPSAEVDDCARKLRDVGERIRRRRDIDDADFDAVRSVAARVRAALRAKKLHVRPEARAQQPAGLRSDSATS